MFQKKTLMKGTEKLLYMANFSRLEPQCAAAVTIVKKIKLLTFTAVLVEVSYARSVGNCGGHIAVQESTCPIRKAPMVHVIEFAIIFSARGRAQKQKGAA